MMDKKRKADTSPSIVKKEEYVYSAEELLKLGKEKNDMDFAKKELSKQ